MKRLAWLLLSMLLCCDSPAAGAGAALSPPDFGSEFSQEFHDGKAELAGYDLVYPRYGALRRGHAVAIFVTEPFLDDARVKPEDPAREDFPVLKLNLVQDFQTGVYDYNLMTSAFVTTRAVGKRPAGSAAKVSFSAQEWCGHVYAQLRFDDTAVRLDSHSYFEGEADQTRKLKHPAGGLAEDALWLWARGMAAPRLPPGGRASVPLLTSLERVRVSHKPLGWQTAELHRAAEPSWIDVPAGRFEVEQHTAEITREDGEKTRWTLYAEARFPHRIIQVERDDGYRASLRGVARLPYWQLHDEGHEAMLERLGLGGDGR